MFGMAQFGGFWLCILRWGWGWGWGWGCGCGCGCVGGAGGGGYPDGRFLHCI